MVEPVDVLEIVMHVYIIKGSRNDREGNTYIIAIYQEKQWAERALQLEQDKVPGYNLNWFIDVVRVKESEDIFGVALLPL